MSAFWTKCPTCGVRYFHCFVGDTLVSGHKCAGPPRPKVPSPYER